MARIRTLKPGYFRSRSLARCSRDARTTFQGLWVEADSAGRGVADPRLLKGSIWPLDDDISPEVIGDHLQELSREHIVLYEVNGDPYYQVLKFNEHQAASYRTGEPEHPAPPEDAGSCMASHATCTEIGAVREGKGRDNTVTSPAGDVTAEDGFEDFWERYPKRNGKRIGKDKAMTVWKRMNKRDRALALGAIDNYASADRIPRDAHRWLRDGDWTDWQTPEKPTPTNGLHRPPKQVEV